MRHGDLDQFLAYNGAGGYRPAGAARGDEVVKVIGLRRRIAENMAASKRNIPHFTYVEECDVTALEELRAQLNSAGRSARADHAAAADRGDLPHAAAVPDAQRAL
jgi:2-oxoisovalerate dehydrogenase E2 component (dihydrolipoyl transacylase)